MAETLEPVRTSEYAAKQRLMNFLRPFKKNSFFNTFSEGSDIARQLENVSHVIAWSLGAHPDTNGTLAGGLKNYIFLSRKHQIRGTLRNQSGNETIGFLPPPGDILYEKN